MVMVRVMVMDVDMNVVIMDIMVMSWRLAMLLGFDYWSLDVYLFYCLAVVVLFVVCCYVAVYRCCYFVLICWLLLFIVVVAVSCWWFVCCCCFVCGLLFCWLLCSCWLLLVVLFTSCLPIVSCWLLLVVCLWFVVLFTSCLLYWVLTLAWRLPGTIGSCCGLLLVCCLECVAEAKNCFCCWSLKNQPNGTNQQQTPTTTSCKLQKVPLLMHKSTAIMSVLYVSAVCFHVFSAYCLLLSLADKQ